MTLSAQSIEPSVSLPAGDPRPSFGGPGGLLWWALLVLPLWAFLALAVHWEPVMRDGWGHVWWLRDRPLSIAVLVEHAKQSYLHMNPRLGQVATLASYTDGPWHTIVTPLIELGVFALLTVHALGRWPSIRRADDAFAALLVTALVVLCAPQVGPMLFYRPFTYNYLFAVGVSLLWLVPYRLAVDRAARPFGEADGRGQPPSVVAARWWQAPVSVVLGIAAGYCNEHTGLAFLAMGLAAWWFVRRRAPGHHSWMLAGLLGLAAGYTVLLTAPGQRERYTGLAAQTGLFERILDRGIAGNLDVLLSLAMAFLPAVPVIAVALLERRRLGVPVRTSAARWAPVVLALAGLVCAGALLASPKIGPRLYFASVALISAGLTGWLVVQLRSAWSRRLCAVLAAAGLAYVAVRIVAISRVAGPIGEARRDRIWRGAGTAVTLPRYPYPPSRYFLGDDLRDAELRRVLVELFYLKQLDLAPASNPALDALRQTPVQ